MPVFHNDGLDDPLAFERLPSFSGGQVSFERANVLQPNQAALLENVTILINGELRKRRGTRPLGSGVVVEGQNAIQGIIQYDTVDRKSLIAFCDQRALSYESGLWSDVFDAGLSSAGERPDIVQLTDDLYWTDSGLGGIRKWDGTTAYTVGDFYTSGGIRALAYDGSGLRAGLGATRNNLMALALTGAVSSHLTTPGQISAVCWDGAHLWVGLQASSENLLKIDALGSVVATVTAGHSAVTALAFDGTHLWAGCGSTTANLRKLDTHGATIGTFDIAAAGVNAICYASSSLWIALDATGASLLKADLSGSVTDEFSLGSNTARSIAFDGSHLWVGLGATEENLAKVTTAGEIVAHYTAGSSALQALAFDGINLWAGTSQATDHLLKIGPSGTVLAASSVRSSQSPAATILERHGTRLVASGVAAIPDAIYFSDFLDGETWDMVNGQIRVGGGDGDPIVAVKSWQDTSLLVFKRNSTWLIDANPLTPVAEFSVKLIHRTVGCAAKRSVAQVGQDVWFLSRTGVQSVSKQLATSNNEISVPVSQAIQDVVQRIRWDHAHKSCGIFYNNYYLLSVPVNSDTPDTVLAFHYLTGGWTIFSGWDAELLYEQPFDGTSRLLLGRSDGEIRTWLDYFATEDEPNDAYQDGGNPLLLTFELTDEGAFFPPGDDVVSTIRTRAMTFDDFVSPKSGFYGEFELVTTRLAATITALLDGRRRTPVKSISYDPAQAALPTALAFSLTGEGWTHERFPIHHLPPFRELQYEIVSPAGKLVLRDVNTSAFLDTVETLATSGEIPFIPPPADETPVNFFPPAVAVHAYIDGGDLVLRAMLGDGTFGAYQLTYLVNGVAMAYDTATGFGTYSKKLTLDLDWWVDDEIAIELQVQSLLPLPAWSATALTAVQAGVPVFFAGSVATSRPAWAYGVAVDYLRGFAYAINCGNNESGPVCRINLTTGRIDEMPVSASYGIYLRQSDGSLFLESTKSSEPALRRYMPHLWNPGEPLHPLTTGGDVSPNTEAGCHVESLGALLIARPGGIDSWPTASLTAPTLYQSTTQPYAVHSLRWEDGKLYWIEGDQSTGHQWSVGGTVFASGPPNGSDIVPVPQLGRAVLVGWRVSTRGAWIVDTSTGAVLTALPGHGDAAIQGCFRLGNHVVVFDLNTSVARQVNASSGAYTDHALPSGKSYATGFYYNGRRIALPFSGAAWNEPGCGIATW